MSDQMESSGALAELSERYRFLAEAMPLVVFTTQRDGTLDYISERIAEYSGKPIDRAGMSAYLGSLVHPDDRAETAARWEQSLATGQDYQVEHRVRRADGEYRWFLVRAIPMRTTDGRVQRWFGTSMDVHDMKLAEHALRSSEERFRSVFAHATVGMALTDLQGRFVQVNEAYTRITGYSEAELRELGFSNITHPADSKLDVDLLRRLLGDEIPSFVIEKRYVCKNGSVVWVQNSVSLSRDSSGRPAHIMRLTEDITERKSAGDALSATRRQLELALTAAELGTFYCPMPMGKIVWSDRCNEHFYQPPGTAMDFDQFYALLHPEDRERTRAAVERAVFGHKTYDIEYRVNGPHLQMRWIRAIGRCFYDTNGQPVRFDGITLDVTQRKIIEQERERLLLSEQTARALAEHASQMKDEFLANLSHELRTPLNAIIGWCQLLRADSSDPTDLAQGMETIERNARAQAQIINDLLDMSRIISGKVRMEVQPVDLVPIIEGAIGTVKPAADAKGVRTHMQLDPAVRPVIGDPDRLQQILWNLLSNAIKFTPRGGTVQIRLEQTNSNVQCSVIDTGEGIEPAFLPFVFDRFRQADASITRRHGGLGLGLSIVKQLVELHGGSIRAGSAGAGRGSAFVVTLPLLTSNPTAGKSSTAAAPGIGRTVVMAAGSDALKNLSVLVVDDDPDARAFMKRLLENHQAKVLTAGSAAEAVGVFQCDPPSVLVCDIGMRDEDGYSLMRRIRALPADRGGMVWAVAVTAYARQEDCSKSINAGFQAHLTKPIEPVELVNAVVKLAAGTSASFKK
jgi:PAS domain S-box-containing protein